MRTRKSLPLLFIFILLIQLFQIFYFRRYTLFTPYDPGYWKNRFEHSQWSLPASLRDIGDDGIYAYGGYRLMRGDSIEKTNTNKPPVGVYLIGVSVDIFHNPSVVPYLFGLVTLAVFYLLCRQLALPNLDSLFAVITLATFPIFYSQMTASLLDLFQAGFLIIHICLLVMHNRNKNQILLFFSGLALGFFIETKPPILAPLLIILEAGYFSYKRKFTVLAILLTGTVTGVFLPYFRYFQNGHSLIDYVRLHKYMTSIYTGGRNELHAGAILQAIFTGYFPDVVNGTATRYGEWTPILPAIFFLGLLSAVLIFIHERKNVYLSGIALFTVASVIIFSSVPSYPRYLLVTMPYVILCAVYLLRKTGKHRFLIYSAVSIFALLYSIRSLSHPDPGPLLSRFFHNYSNLYFQDIYQEQIAGAIVAGYSREEFRNMTQAVLQKAGIYSLSVEETGRNIGESRGTVTLRVDYHSITAGTISEDKEMELEKRDNRWVIDWNWDCVMNGYTPGDTLHAETTAGSRGTITDKRGNTIARDRDGLLLSIYPEKLDREREKEILKILAEISRIGEVFIHNTYTENPVIGLPVPVLSAFTEEDMEKMRKISSSSGIVLTDWPSRIYANRDDTMTIKNTIYAERGTRIYNSSTYHGVGGAEKEFDSILTGHNGGKMTLVDSTGKLKRVVWDEEAGNGKDVYIAR